MVHDELGPSQPIARRRTRHRDDDEDLEHDESRPSQPPVRRYRRRRATDDEARPSQQHTEPDSLTASTRGRGRGRGRGRVSHALANLY